ncbi:MAG: hypothetical protein AAF465_01855 [Pseudomonadota bacterium]
MTPLLELSLCTTDILRDMGRFSDLGFEEYPVNESVPHPYGVMGDGRFFAGLHGADFASPTLTYVVPNLVRIVPALSDLEIEFERADLGDDQFNQISFYDPGNQRINLIEARTFSPAYADTEASHTLGAFQGIELPHSDARQAFWEQLQLVVETMTQQSVDAESVPLVDVHPDRARLTVRYRGDLDTLIMHSAQQGWRHFSVTADNEGLYRTDHQFDFVIQSASS